MKMVMLFNKVIVTYGERKHILYPYQNMADISFLINGGIAPENCIDVDREGIQTVIDALPFAIPSNAVPFINGKKADSKSIWNAGDRIEFRDAEAVCTEDQRAMEVAERKTSPAVATPAAEDLKESGGLIVDLATFTVVYKGTPCTLGNIRAFHLLARLNRRPGTYIPIDTLIQDVWHGKSVSHEAVQRQISTLRAKLKQAGIVGIVLDGTQPDHYRLTLN